MIHSVVNTSQPVKIDWGHRDLSASSYALVRVPAWAHECCIGIGWTDVDSPTGTITVEETDSAIATSGALTYTSTTNPAGTAGSTLIRRLAVSAPFLIVRYTVASGGVGDYFTDSTGTAGTSPTITWRP